MTDEESLSELLRFICAEGQYYHIGGGITTYFDDNQENLAKHYACMVLEVRGQVFRSASGDDWVVWGPKI